MHGFDGTKADKRGRDSMSLKGFWWLRGVVNILHLTEWERMWLLALEVSEAVVNEAHLPVKSLLLLLLSKSCQIELRRPQSDFYRLLATQAGWAINNSQFGEESQAKETGGLWKIKEQNLSRGNNYRGWGGMGEGWAGLSRAELSLNPKCSFFSTWEQDT